MEKGLPGKSSTVFVGNIPYDATEDDIKAHFSKAGKVESFRMVYDKETKQPKGYGFCDFADPDTALKAIKTLSEEECNGRKLRLDLADNVMRGPPGSAGSTALALPAPGSGSGSSSVRPRIAGPTQPPAPIKTSGTTEASGIIKASGQIDPAAAAAATAAADPNATPEAIMAAVTAHTQIAQTVAAMPQAQLQLCLGTMQELAKASPEQARATLLENPQLCYALLHAQFLLGLTLEPVLPPDLNESQELRNEAVQRVMANAKSRGRGAVIPPPRPPHFGVRPQMPGMVVPGMTALPGAFGQAPGMTKAMPPRPPLPCQAAPMDVG